MDENHVLTFINPATGEKFGEVATASPEQAKAAIREMRAAHIEWSRKPVEERARILGRFQQVIIDAADEISLVINQDNGKTRQDGLIELFMTVDLLDKSRKNAVRWLRREKVPSGLYVTKKCYIERRPYGVVLVIAPWNYPFYLALPPVLSALLAGNTVVLKPSEVTAATGALIQRLFERVPGLYPYVRVVEGGPETGEALVDGNPDYVFFTGSTGTGKKVLQKAAGNLIPVTCELGGKDPAIVLEDADIKQAAKWIAWGAFYNTGQTCMAVERVYVVEPVYHEFVREVVKETKKLKVGFTHDRKSPYYMGPMTVSEQIKVFDQHLDDALAKGARVLYKGKRHGMFVEPVVIANVDHSMLVMQEETFGPILPVMSVKDEAEAVRLANDNKFGLGASVWSRDKKRAEEIVHQLNVGTALINDTIAQIAIPMIPFGGVKQSGYGRVHGKEGLLEFTYPQGYAVGNTPHPLDLATVMRRPGNYWVADSILKLVFGMDTRQRLQPLSAGVKKIQTMDRRKQIAGLGFLGMLAGTAGVFLFRKGRKPAQREPAKAIRANGFGEV